MLLVRLTEYFQIHQNWDFELRTHRLPPLRNTYHSHNTIHTLYSNEQGVFRAIMYGLSKYS